MSNELVICGAAYGRADVTGKIRSLRKDQKLFVKASNDVFGDSWSAENKSLVVVYKYVGSNCAQLQVVEEGGYLQIIPPSSSVGGGWKNRQLSQSLKANMTVSRKDQSPLKLNILGAVYGLCNVTPAAQSFVTANQEFDKAVSDAVWGDGWPGHKKTLVVVYEYSDISMLEIALEGDQMHFIASPPLTILGAAYGLKNVTEILTKLVKNRSLKVSSVASGHAGHAEHDQNFPQNKEFLSAKIQIQIF
jgi:hypothetical protein